MSRLADPAEHPARSRAISHNYNIPALNGVRDRFLGGALA